MLSFFRDGFFRDLLVVLVLTIIVGTVFSQGVAWAIDTYFGGTLDGVIGEYGEYDLILHVREEAKEAAWRELERLGEQHFPGYKLNQSLTIGGQANFFFGLPPQDRTKEVFEGIMSVFGAVPGLNGYTLMVEPSIVIRGVHPGVEGELRERSESLPGAKFAFRDGANLIVVTEDEEQIQALTEQIKGLLQTYQILELRFPMGFEVDTQRVGEQVLALLQKGSGPGFYENVTSAEYGEDLDAFLKTLVEMRDFLSSYASKVRIELAPEVHLSIGERVVLQETGAEEPELIVEISGVYEGLAEGLIVQGSPTLTTDRFAAAGYRYPVEDEGPEYIGEVEIENERYRLAYAINESLRLLGELEALSVQANAAVLNAEAVLTTFQEALMQLEVLQVQMRQLNQGLASGEAKSSGEQFLVSLLLNGLFQTLAQAAVGAGEGSLDSLENLDVEEMRASLDGISQQIVNVQDIDVAAIIDQIQFVRDTLPNLRDEEIGQSIRLINTYLGGQVIPGERIQILVKGQHLDEKNLERLFREELDNPYLHTYSTTVGAINPNARGEIFRVLKEVRAIVAGMLAIIFTAIVLVLDHATIFSTLKYLRSSGKSRRKGWLRLFDPLLVLGGALGVLILFSVYYLSGAQIPLATPALIVGIGFGLGLLAVVFAERFSPVEPMEIMAGQALGLSNLQIMREIVIPPSRPGFLNLLNRWKKRF